MRKGRGKVGARGAPIDGRAKNASASNALEKGRSDPPDAESRQQRPASQRRRSKAMQSKSGGGAGDCPAIGRRELGQQQEFVLPCARGTSRRWRRGNRIARAGATTVVQAGQRGEPDARWFRAWTPGAATAADRGRRFALSATAWLRALLALSRGGATAATSSRGLSFRAAASRRERAKRLRQQAKAYQADDQQAHCAACEHGTVPTGGVAKRPVVSAFADTTVK
jgi:hypothetical protein